MVFGTVEASSQTEYNIFRELNEGQGLFDTEEDAMMYMEKHHPLKWFRVVDIYRFS